MTTNQSYDDQIISQVPDFFNAEAAEQLLVNSPSLAPGGEEESTREECIANLLEQNSYFNESLERENLRLSEEEEEEEEERKKGT